MDVKSPQSLNERLATAAVPQQPFRWKRPAWESVVQRVPGGPRLLANLPDAVDRISVLNAVSRAISDEQYVPAFIAAMIWGYGDSGYGPTRVRWILTGTRSNASDASIREDLVDRLRISTEKVRTDGPVEGFRYLNNEGRIKFLGSAFFTKWLYFASAGSDPNNAHAAPILDKQVHNWLKSEADLELRIHRTPDYERYVQLLEAWGKPFDRTPIQVEKEIFTLATGRG